MLSDPLCVAPEPFLPTLREPLKRIAVACEGIEHEELVDDALWFVGLHLWSVGG